MFFVYTVIYWIALLIIFPFEYLKRPASLRQKWLREKTGRLDFDESSTAGIAVHAVSVGEVIAAEPLVKAFKEEYPELTITVFTITDTGQEVARKRLNSIARTAYLPFDLPSMVRKATDKIKPGVFVVMETEMWPNLMRCLAEDGIPVILANGRVSEASYKGYRKIRFFMKKTLEKTSLFCMQNETYARRIIDIGADEKKVTITGNFKFDVARPTAKPSWMERLNGPVIVAGSTHRGEEELIIDAYIKLRPSFRDLRLIVAPRHPERFDEVEKLIISKGLRYRRKSRLDEGSPSVILIDTIGELFSVYGGADIAVMGGSFIEHGGQNPLEPACWGKPVVCGPHMWNFPFIEDFYKEGAAVKADHGTLCDVLKDLLSSPERMREIGGRAKGILDRNRGAVSKTLKALEGFIT